MTADPFAEEIDFREIKLEGVVGKGSFGTVKKGKWRNLDVAVKVIETEQEKQAFIVEVKQLSRVNHPNIVKLYGACTKQPVCLIMEYAEGGSLYNVLHCMKQVEYTAAHAISWLLQCATGVAYLHNMKPRPLIHRDLKPPNLLLVSGGTMLKICDFGTACDKHTNMTNSKGSAAWMAPEVFEGSQYSEKCDIFSWAIILWEVLTRKKPFHDGEGATAFGIMWAVHRGKRPPLIQGCPKPIETLMTKCWAKDPMTRPSMSEVQNELAQIFKFMKGSDRPITSLSQQVTTNTNTSIIISGPRNDTGYSDSKTVLPLGQEFQTGIQNSVSLNTEDKLLCQDSKPDKTSKDMKKRRSADLSSTDIKLPSHFGHRRSGSCDSPYLQQLDTSSNLSKHDLPSSSTSRLMEEVNETKNVPDSSPNMPHGNSFFFLLEPKLQPLPPVQCEESIAIYHEHLNLAGKLFWFRNEISVLSERRNELQKQLKDQDNSYTYIDEYLQLKKEKESLLQLRQNLKRQLEIIRGRKQGNINANSGDKVTGDEWVMI